MKGKAQSAMEFLMTYGWAILIMLVVVGVLFMLGVFNPQTASPNSCVLPAGFSCYGYVIRDGGVLEISIGQATGGDVKITEMACDEDDTGQTWVSPNVTVRSGKYANITTAPTCYTLSNIGPAEGDFYRGTLFINYLDLRTNIPHKIKGDISYKVEAT